MPLLLGVLVILGLTTLAYSQPAPQPKRCEPCNTECFVARIVSRAEKVRQQRLKREQADLTNDVPKDLVSLSGNTLEALQRSNPERFDKVRQILSRLDRDGPTWDVVDWMQDNFDARDMDYKPMFMTNPPKGRFYFTLDDTRYVVPAATWLCP